MAFSQLPATLATLFVAFTAHLDACHVHLVCQLFLAGYFPRGRRTVLCANNRTLQPPKATS